MELLQLALLIAAAILFLLAAINVPSRISLVAAGLLCWVMVPLLNAATTFKG